MESTIIKKDEVDYINIRDAINSLKQLLKKIADLETNMIHYKLLDRMLHTF